VLSAALFQALLFLFLLLVGSAQRFLDPVLESLYSLARWTSWLGFVACLLFFIPWHDTAFRLRAKVITLATSFFVLWAASEFWGSWIFPSTLWGSQ